MVDPDFELTWGPGFGLLALPAFLPSVISSFFTQNKVGGGGGGLGPSPRSATVFRHDELLVTFDLAAKDTIVRCRSFFSCAGVRAGKEPALAAKIYRQF